ncbi:hypothetical protein [Otariodibacter oris]|uniref:Uncharacterized protein n=1 Tax=Otariodibacter oris TaxID=1032623 RepID=A0A420XIT2_9PAST|nr:hypothetical protein [Otariodibacter oris]QGM80706.1 hypothetical protein A6A10_04445 [Otariodibacter oris]RKR77133.1 hypothetical protein DES31_0456 [Otariodibacter oris]
MANKATRQAEQKTFTYIKDVLPQPELNAFKNAKSSLWNAQSMLEVIARADIQDIEPHILQSAIRGINEIVLDSVAQLEEL